MKYKALWISEKKTKIPQDSQNRKGAEILLHNYS